MKIEKFEKYSVAWAEDKKKECKWCQHTSYYCKLHAPRTIIKSSRVWGGMHHSEACKFYQQLNKNAAVAIVRYCAIVQVDSTLPDFKGWDMKCPDCKGYDSRLQKI